MSKRGGMSLHQFISREAASTGQLKHRPTAAQLSVLWSHWIVDPKPVAWTSDLCRRRTWEALYEGGYLKGGRLTNIGRAAIRAPFAILSSEVPPVGSEQRDEGTLPPAEPLDHLSGEGSRESGE